METYIKMGYLRGFVTLDRTEEVSSKKSTAIAFIEDAFIWGKGKNNSKYKKMWTKVTDRSGVGS